MKKLFSAVILMMIFASCDDDEITTPPVVSGVDPTTAEKVSIDRFSAEAGTLMVRTSANGLPEANAAINYDQAPFITQGLGPNGESAEYYNFDVQSTTPANIYALQTADGSEVTGQLMIIDVVPGDEGYSDFWLVNVVTVPDDYVANSATSLEELTDAGYAMSATTTIVNCPIVPDGSTASLGGGAGGLHQGWYKGMAAFYFTFMEKDLTAAGGLVPTSPIYVLFNVNPDDANPDSGPASGFVAEAGSIQTHNVLATLPEDGSYSPLWSVNVIDNADFDIVSDLSSATSANVLANGVATVNCPVVSTTTPENPATAAQVSIDRFSEAAGTLMVRNATNGLPAANMAINFDSGAPFITTGLAADGSVASYYNFDVQPVDPAPIYAFFRPDGSPVVGQINVIDVIPGDDGYNDFWLVNKVTVSESYVANTVTSLTGIQDAGYSIETTTTVVNCPVVPAGSTASMRIGDEASGMHMGWYKGEVAFYFTFMEAAITTNADGEVPLSPIYVTFNINPDQPDGGPSSGFMTEMGTVQTHNVLATSPGDGGYSPLWSVNVVDNADFDNVSDLTSAIAANVLATGVATVNCPVVDQE